MGKCTPNRCSDHQENTYDTQNSPPDKSFLLRIWAHFKDIEWKEGIGKRKNNTETLWGIEMKNTLS